MQTLLEKLDKTKAETLGYFGLADDLLSRKYEPEKWNVRYLLNHLADAETVLFERIRRIISEPKKVIWAFDESLWAEHLDYSKIPLNLSKNLFSATRFDYLLRRIAL
jgi:DinB superfamily